MSKENETKPLKQPAVSNRLLLDVYSTISDMQQEMWDTENHFKDETYKKIQKVKEEIKAILNGC